MLCILVGVHILLDTNDRHVSTVWNIGASKFWWWPLAYCLTLNLSCPRFQCGNVQEPIIFLFFHIDFVAFLLAQVLTCTITNYILKSKVTNHISFSEYLTLFDDVAWYDAVWAQSPWITWSLSASVQLQGTLVTSLFESHSQIDRGATFK